MDQADRSTPKQNSWTNGRRGIAEEEGTVWHHFEVAGILLRGTDRHEHFDYADFSSHEAKSKEE